MDLNAFDDLEAAFVPLPVGQMIEAWAPAAFKVRASFQTRRSKGRGRFSTTISTWRPFSGSPGMTAAFGYLPGHHQPVDARQH